MHYVLCYPKLEADDLARIEAFRRAHEPARAKLVPAHITLVFGVASISAEALAGRVTAVVRDSAPFAFAFDGMEVSAHEGGDHNLFLRVGEGKDRLSALHEALYEGLERGREIEFTPHMTIATNAELKPIFTCAVEAKPLTAITGRIESLDVATLSGDTLYKVASCPLVGSD